MGKSRHRKKHKKKLAQRNEKIKQATNGYKKKLEEMYGEEMAKAIEAQKKKEGDNSIDDIPTSGGFIGE